MSDFCKHPRMNDANMCCWCGSVMKQEQSRDQRSRHRGDCVKVIVYINPCVHNLHCNSVCWRTWTILQLVLLLYRCWTPSGGISKFRLCLSKNFTKKYADSHRQIQLQCCFPLQLQEVHYTMKILYVTTNSSTLIARRLWRAPARLGVQVWEDFQVRSILNLTREDARSMNRLLSKQLCRPRVADSPNNKLNVAHETLSPSSSSASLSSTSTPKPIMFYIYCCYDAKNMTKISISESQIKQ